MLSINCTDWLVYIKKKLSAEPTTLIKYIKYIKYINYIYYIITRLVKKCKNRYMNWILKISPGTINKIVEIVFNFFHLKPQSTLVHCLDIHLSRCKCTCLEKFLGSCFLRLEIFLKIQLLSEAYIIVTPGTGVHLRHCKIGAYLIVAYLDALGLAPQQPETFRVLYSPGGKVFFIDLFDISKKFKKSSKIEKFKSFDTWKLKSVQKSVTCFLHFFSIF